MENGIYVQDTIFSSFEVRATTFESDVPPQWIFGGVVNTDKLDGQEGSYYLDFSN